MLYEVCSVSNSRCYFVTEPSDIQKDWFAGVASVGISGATSTPLWLMEEVKIEIINLLTN
jgi:4-hydroxy-3-methylbut-2-enyl diphosphate reductase